MIDAHTRDLDAVRRGAAALLHRAKPDPLVVLYQLAAIENCPDATAAMGRALTFGACAGGAPGPNRGRTIEDHLAAAQRHLAIALVHPDALDDGEGGTGELHATCAAARMCLAVEMLGRVG